MKVQLEMLTCQAAVCSCDQAEDITQELAGCCGVPQLLVDHLLGLQASLPADPSLWSCHTSAHGQLSVLLKLELTMGCPQVAAE